MFVSAVALLLAGCTADVDAGDEETGLENTGEVQDALGEATCGTTAPIDYDDLNTTWGTSATHSSTTSYGSALCTEAFVGRYRNVTSGVKAYASWNDTIPTTQAACENMRVQLYTYASDGLVIGGATMWGEWQTIDGEYYFCNPPRPAISLWKAGIVNYQPRAVASAYQCATFACTSYTRKSVSVYAGI